MGEIRKLIPSLEESLTKLVREFEERTGAYVADMWIVREKSDKPLSMRVGTIISINKPKL